MFRILSPAKLSSFFVFISTSCIVINLITLLGGVFSRYLLGSSPIWVDELSRYLMVGGVMLAAGVVLFNKEHMRLNVIDRIASRKIRFVVGLYRELVTVSISLFMAYFSLKYALSISNFTTMGLSISKTIPMMALPAGFFSLTLYSVVNLFSQFSTDKETP